MRTETKLGEILTNLPEDIRAQTIVQILEKKQTLQWGESPRQEIPSSMLLETLDYAALHPALLPKAIEHVAECEGAQREDSSVLTRGAELLEEVVDNLDAFSTLASGESTGRSALEKSYHNRAASLLWKAKKLTEAAPLFEKAERWTSAGDCWYSVGEWDEAIRCYELGGHEPGTQKARCMLFKQLQDESVVACDFGAAARAALARARNSGKEKSEEAERFRYLALITPREAEIYVGRGQEPNQEDQAIAAQLVVDGELVANLNYYLPDDSPDDIGSRIAEEMTRRQNAHEGYQILNGERIIPEEVDFTNPAYVEGASRKEWRHQNTPLDSVELADFQRGVNERLASR